MRKNQLDIQSLENLLIPQLEEDWTNKIIMAANSLCFDQFIFAVLRNKLEPIENAYIQSNYALEWRKIYDERKLGYIDPTVAHCLDSTRPLIWDRELFVTQDQKNMYEEASVFDLQYGIIFPIYGSNGEFGMCAFSSKFSSRANFNNHLFHTLPQLSLLKEYIFESSRQFNGHKDNKNMLHITPRELEIIQWTIVGKTCWEISKILGCSQAVIHFHINNLRKKFNVRTKLDIMLKAVAMGVVHM